MRPEFGLKMAGTTGGSDPIRNPDGALPETAKYPDHSWFIGVHKTILADGAAPDGDLPVTVIVSSMIFGARSPGCNGPLE